MNHRGNSVRGRQTDEGEEEEEQEEECEEEIMSTSVSHSHVCQSDFILED